MAEITDHRMPDHHEHLWRCACYGSHFLSVSWYDGDGEGWLSLSGDFRASRLRHRLAMAWKLLRHGHADSWVELDLAEGETAREIAGVLSQWADSRLARKEG